MSEYNLGRVLPKFLGDYDSKQIYNLLDVVYYNGSSYVCMTDDTTGIEPSNNTNWQLVARRGAETEISDEQLEAIKQVCISYLVNAGAVFDSDYNHTSNDFSDTYEAKLNGIESGAQVNVQADWNETDSTKDSYILNKPNYNETDNNFSDEYREKLEALDPTAQPNVQADWQEANSNRDSYIKNKPTLAEVATTGSYNSLKNKPTLFDGNYNSLTNKPTIPTRISQLTNDQVFIVPPTVYDKGEQANVNIELLNGNEKYHCGHLKSLTIQAFGANTYLPTYIYFEDTPDVSLNLTVPDSLKWVTETPLFYANNYTTSYCIRIEDKVAQLFILANSKSTYPDEVEETARWKAATNHDDPENWEQYKLF